MVSSKTSKTGPDVALRCIRGFRFWAIPISYETINTSNNAGKSTAFIEFMLAAIKASLIDTLRIRAEISDGTIDKAAMRWKQIESFLQIHAYIMNADVRKLCAVSPAMANRILAGFSADEKLMPPPKVVIGSIYETTKPTE